MNFYIYIQTKETDLFICCCFFFSKTVNHFDFRCFRNDKTPNNDSNVMCEFNERKGSFELGLEFHTHTKVPGHKLWTCFFFHNLDIIIWSGNMIHSSQQSFDWNHECVLFSCNHIISKIKPIYYFACHLSISFSVHYCGFCKEMYNMHNRLLFDTWSFDSPNFFPLSLDVFGRHLSRNNFYLQ